MVANPIPKSMLATYWPTWSGPVPISSIPYYNTVMLAFATPGDTAGSVAFGQNRESRSTFMSDIQSVRSCGRAVLLAVGGAGSYGLTGLTTDEQKIGNAVSQMEDNWIPSMGGDASKTGLGFGFSPRSTGETMTLSGMLTVWRALVQNYPSLRGVFSWEVSCDRDNNYQFAANMANVHA